MFENLKILDLSRVLSGPNCSQMFAELGAGVIKVEKPDTGDETREWYAIKDEWSGYFLALNRSKKSITLDLKKKEALEILYKLVKECDVIIENFTPGVADKLGVGYKKLKELNPSLIYLSISAYGQSGHSNNLKGYDPIIQADTGIMDLTGEKTGPPAKSMIPIADISASLYGAFAISSALYRREREGIGEYIDIALYDSVISMMGIIAAIPFMDNGKIPERYGSSHPHRVPSKNFKASDGVYVHIICNNQQWLHLCEVLQLNEKYMNKPYTTDIGRKNNREEIDQVIQNEISKHTSELIIEKLKEKGVPCARVNNLNQVLNSKQIVDRNLMMEWTQTELGKITGINYPYKFKNTETKIRSSAPKLGEQTLTILKELGYSKKEIEQFEASNIV